MADYPWANRSYHWFHGLIQTKVRPARVANCVTFPLLTPTLLLKRILGKRISQILWSLSSLTKMTGLEQNDLSGPLEHSIQWDYNIETYLCPLRRYWISSSPLQPSMQNHLLLFKHTLQLPTFVHLLKPKSHPYLSIMSPFLKAKIKSQSSHCLTHWSN